MHQVKDNIYPQLNCGPLNKYSVSTCICTMHKTIHTFKHLNNTDRRTYRISFVIEKELMRVRILTHPNDICANTPYFFSLCDDLPKTNWFSSLSRHAYHAHESNFRIKVVNLFDFKFFTRSRNNSRHRNLSDHE